MKEPAKGDYVIEVSVLVNQVDGGKSVSIKEAAVLDNAEFTPAAVKRVAETAGERATEAIAV